MWILLPSPAEMASLKLNMQDQWDLEKFTRFLALKATQIIVQSRIRGKMNTKCKPNSSGTDWVIVGFLHNCALCVLNSIFIPLLFTLYLQFNLAIYDLPDIMAEAKRTLCVELISSTVPMCIEISLKTVDGDVLVLETWSLGVLPEQSDPTVRVTYTVYNRMGILLKSLLSVSRITAAYKLGRRQGADSFAICYRTYMGEPQLHGLGVYYHYFSHCT